MSINTPPIRIGVSLTSLFFSISPFLPNYGRRLNEFCEKTGLGLHLIPFWMMSVSDILLIQNEYVISYEEAWIDQRTAWQWIKKLPKNPGSFFKPLLFGFPTQDKKHIMWFQKRFKHAFAINTDGNFPLTKASLINWHKTIKLTEQGHLICIDLRYGHGNPLSLKLCTRGLSELIKKIPNTIKLIYLGTDDTEGLINFTLPDHCQKTAIETMLCMFHPLLQKDTIPVIISITPYPKKMILDIERRIRQIISPSISHSL